MNQNPTPPDHHTILEDAWDQVVGGMGWLKSVLFGEFADHRPYSALVADMLVSFVPGVVIVTSARDAVAVILRLATHPEKREELMEWVLLSACLIVIALPLAMAAGGAVAAGVGAIVGGLAGTELGAALRAVMLLLIKEASKLVDVIRFLQKFIKGDVLRFLRAVKFVKYEKALLYAVKKWTGKLIEVVKALRVHLESLHYFDSVKHTIAKLTEWEKRFYAVQEDALKLMPKALAELDARLAKILAQTAPKEAHTVVAGVETDKTLAGIPAKQHVQDTPGQILSQANGHDAGAKLGENSGTRNTKSVPSGPSGSNGKPPPKEKPAPIKPPEEGPNAKKQDSLDAEAVIIREKAAKLSEKIGTDIKNHPLRQAYEAEVAGLKEEAETMAKSGANQESIAKKMWERRREIGVKYKYMTPEPLRDYIYEVNTARYGDPFGPSFESLVQSAEKKMMDPYKKIIQSSSTPNSDVNGLLSKFEEWLTKKDPSYLDEAITKLGD